MQMHVFSVIRNPTQSSTFTLLVKDQGPGTYTHKLWSMVDKLPGTRVRMDGLYGKVSVPVERHSSVVLIAGGVGLTPMLDILGIEWDILGIEWLNVKRIKSPSTVRIKVTCKALQVC